MPIPDFQSLMLPILKFYGDKREHGSQDALTYLKTKLKLSDEEINELLPSGKQYRLNNRIGWAIIYLMKSGLLNRPSRAKYIITSKGSEVLKEKPEKINMKYLERFQEYLDFKDFRNETIEDKSLPSGCDRISTPQESLESSYQELRRQLSHDLLERVKLSSPAFFETLVVDLLLKLGYGGSRIDAGRAIGRTGDDGSTELSKRTNWVSMSFISRRKDGRILWGDLRFRLLSGVSKETDPGKEFLSQPRNLPGMLRSM